MIATQQTTVRPNDRLSPRRIDPRAITVPGALNFEADLPVLSDEPHDNYVVRAGRGYAVLTLLAIAAAGVAVAYQLGTLDPAINWVQTTLESYGF